jgi:hypothetical protein
MSFSSFWNKKLGKPLAKLRIVRLDYPVESNCAVCLEWHPCHHYDRDFSDFVCVGCADDVRSAEIQLRAFIVERMHT